MEFTDLQKNLIDEYSESQRNGLFGVVDSVIGLTWACESSGKVVAMTDKDKAVVVSELARRFYLAPTTIEVQALQATINALKDENQSLRAQAGSTVARLEIGLSPEVKAVLGKLSLRGKVGCDICWTDSWQPCEPDTPDAINNPEFGWMVCECCRLADQLRAARANTPQGFGPEGRVN